MVQEADEDISTYVTCCSDIEYVDGRHLVVSCEYLKLSKGSRRACIYSCLVLD